MMENFLMELPLTSQEPGEKRSATRKPIGIVFFNGREKRPTQIDSTSHRIDTRGLAR